MEAATVVALVSAGLAAIIAVLERPGEMAALVTGFLAKRR